VKVMLRRMLRAALLDASAYEDVEGDRGATRQAVGVVVLASAAAGVGSFENNGWSGIPVITLASLAGWWLWAGITCFVGTRVLPKPETVADVGELLRTIGFAASPGLLLVLAAIPPLASVTFPVCGLWMLVAMVIGVRQALDYEGPGGTARAVAVCAIGFPVYAAGVAVSLLAIGPWPV